MNMSHDSYGQRPPLEWEIAAEFKQGSIGIKVSRAKGTPRFSLAICAVSSRDDARLLSHFPVRWEASGGELTLTEPDINLADLEIVRDKAKAFILETLRKEGRHERRDFGTNREPQRKGKTDRDRNRRRDRGRDE